MCDRQTERDIQTHTENGGSLNRRDFNKLVAVGALAASFPKFAVAASSLNEAEVMVSTPDGDVDCLLVSPKKGKHPAIIMWPDIMGRRASYDAMGRRLAGQGYTVLVVNPFYRDVKGAALPEGVTFPSEAAWDALRPMRAKLTKPAVVSDAKAFFSFLDNQASVDTNRQGAVMGFCMSGTFAMFAAEAMPLRVGAISTFHGGGLATNEPDSPHLTIANSDAQALHAIAENDDEKHPEMKTLLKDAYRKAGLHAEVEVYEGTLHGWTPPDSRVYNEAQAERAWKHMSTLFTRAL